MAKKIQDPAKVKTLPSKVGKSQMQAGGKVLCYGNYEPGGTQRTLFVGEIIREIDFAEQFPKAGSRGTGWQIRVIEGRGPLLHKVKGDKGEFCFLGNKDVKPFDAVRRKIWVTYNTKKSRAPKKKKRRK